MGDRVAIVVGAGPGVGQAVARRFARENFKVGLIARRPETLEQQRAELEKTGYRAKARAADAGDASALTAAIRALAAELGPPTVLIYNAAALRQSKASEVSQEALLQDFKVNVTGAIAAVQAVLPGMRKLGKGTILFTGGGLSLDPHPQYASLALGKAGIRSVALSLSKELEPEGIHVATVTICGIVKAGTRFDPDRIAEDYLRLHLQGKGGYEREMVWR